MGVMQQSTSISDTFNGSITLLDMSAHPVSLHVPVSSHGINYLSPARSVPKGMHSCIKHYFHFPRVYQLAQDLLLLLKQSN